MIVDLFDASMVNVSQYGINTPTSINDQGSFFSNNYFKYIETFDVCV